MARKTIDQRLEAEKQKRQELDDRIRRLQSQQTKMERARDTRRKVLIGEIALAALDSKTDENETIRDWLRRLVPETIERQIDKELLLEILDSKPKQ